MSSRLIEFRGLRFAWPGESTPLFDCHEFVLDRGEHIFIRGASGSGKSTLLNLIAGVLVPQAGNLMIMDQDTRTLGPARRDRLRADHIGYVFQQFNLVPYLSLMENVLLPCRFSQRRTEQATSQFGSAEKAAMYLLGNLFDGETLDLDRPVSKLSVGQQQRVAAARALIGAPDIVIADEPTSSLDADARERFMTLLFDQLAGVESTLLFVSHDSSLSARSPRVVDVSEFKSEATA